MKVHVRFDPSIRIVAACVLCIVVVVAAVFFACLIIKTANYNPFK